MNTFDFIPFYSSSNKRNSIAKTKNCNVDIWPGRLGTSIWMNLFRNKIDLNDDGNTCIVCTGNCQNFKLIYYRVHEHPTTLNAFDWISCRAHKIVHKITEKKHINTPEETNNSKNNEKTQYLLDWVSEKLKKPFRILKHFYNVSVIN